MSKNLIIKLIRQVEDKNGTYATFELTDEGLALTSDDGTRKSTRRFKIPKKEIESYERMVRNLDERCILFTHLNKVEFILRNKRSAIFEKSRGNNNLVFVSGCKVAETNLKNSKWIVYNDKDGAVALRLKENKSRFDVLPVDGGLFNSIHEKEKTGLLFCVSGSLEGIKRALCNIIMFSGGNKINMMSLFSVLPSTMDEENVYNLELLKAAKEVCDRYPLFNTMVGLNVGKHKIMMGTKDVTSLFPQELLSELFAGNKYWLAPCEEGSREEYFIMDNGVPKIDREAFLRKIFDDFYLDSLYRILEKANDRWLRRFYIFCAEPIVEDRVRSLVYTGFKNIKSIRDAKGNMRFPNEVTIVPEGIKALVGSVVVKNTLIFPGGHSDDYSDLLLDLLKKNLSIKIYSRTPEMKQMAKDMAQKKQSINRSYVEKLLLLAAFDKDHPEEVDFSEYAIFPYNLPRGLKRSKASDIVIGKPYIKEGNLISKAINNPPLWDGLKKLANPDEIETIIEFAEKFGAVGHLHIIKQRAENHRNFYKELYVEGKQGRRDTSIDYTINGLDKILKMRSIQLSRMVWDCILSVDYDEAENYLVAEYSSNNRETVNRTDSSLLQILRERTWIKDRQNRLRKPRDIKMDEISNDLGFDSKNPILKALNFGSAIKQREEDIKLLKKLADKTGMKIVDEKEYIDFIQWKAGQKKNDLGMI